MLNPSGILHFDDRSFSLTLCRSPHVPLTFPTYSPSYTGSSPIDLFKLRIEDLFDVLSEDKRKINEYLAAENFTFTVDTTQAEFTAKLKVDG